VAQMTSISSTPRFLPIPGIERDWTSTGTSTGTATAWMAIAGTPGMRALRENDPFMPLTDAAESTSKADNPDGIEKDALEAAQGFESIFVQYLLKTMRSALPDVGIMGKSFASSTYQGMFDEYLSQKAGESGGLGLADLLYHDIVRERQGRTAYQDMLDGSVESAPVGWAVSEDSSL